MKQEITIVLCWKPVHFVAPVTGKAQLGLTGAV